MAFGRPTVLRQRARLLWYGLAAAASVSCLSWVDSCFLPPASRTLSRRSNTADVAAAAASVGAVGLLPSEAWAKGGIYGPLEGKASSLVHPFIMGALFLVTCYVGFLGWQWRETRTIAGPIKELQAEIKKHAQGREEGAELNETEKKLQADLDELTSRRKELAEGKYKAKHHEMSALLLGGGIFFTVYGTANTWMRTEKLFPGPHLFAGAAVCVLWVLAAACVPFMEKGNEVARYLHIGFNGLSVLLFAWQLPTGWEILMKVFNAPIPILVKGLI